MARPLRVQYAGARYHLMSRGDRQEAIFWGDSDRERFVGTLGETCVKCGWIVDAYCLMGNHFHLVIETPQPNLVVGMKWLLGTYTIRFNARHRVRGHLFSGRYKSVLVDESDDHYMRTACDYVHLNPARADLILEGERLESYRWSSFPSYLAHPSKRVPWLRTTRLLGEHGIQRDDRKGRREFSERMEVRSREDEEGAWRPLRKGWRFGADDFLDRIDRWISQANPTDRTHVAAERFESDEVRARNLIAEALVSAGWDEDRLKTERKGHSTKVEIAELVRKQTPMTMGWVAKELHMGSWRSARNLLQRRKRGAGK